MPDTPTNDADAKAEAIIKTVELIHAASRDEKKSWRDALKTWAIRRGLSWLLRH